jgi:predicted exporter
LIKYSNFIIFAFLILIVWGLQSHTSISTSLLSVLPKGESKEIIQHFHETQNAKILLVSVKGFDEEALTKINALEEKLTNVPHITAKIRGNNKVLQDHLNKYHLFRFSFDEEKFENIDVEKSLKRLYMEMITSFVPLPLDIKDPFALVHGLSSKKIALKNGHLVLGSYGYISYFSLKTNTLEEHQEVYKNIHYIVDKLEDVKVFSPVFYYVENAKAIRSDVNSILIIALVLLLTLYLVMLRDMKVLIYTVVTLASSALFSTIILTFLYDEISIFVFVFGVSISSIAIDYMFHQYMHGYYVSQKGFNKEVFFGFLTTMAAFFILSFTSFLLIKQITLFAMLSLFISYAHFAFLYPYVGFKPYILKHDKSKVRSHFISVKVFFLFSLLLLISTLSIISFDLNIRNLDYDNKPLKKMETFFSEHLESTKYHSFMLRETSIDSLITHAHSLQKSFPTINIPIAKLLSKKRFQLNNEALGKMDSLRTKLQREADDLKFRKNHFNTAYMTENKLPVYTIKLLKSYGLEILKIGDKYVSYGTVNEEEYLNILKVPFVESLSLKEHFEKTMKNTMTELIYLGLLTLVVIIALLWIFTKKALLYALVFLLFPVAIVSMLSYFIDINILHIFMLFVILAISIDYAVYLSSSQDILTKKAISYSLMSTFAGFGVLIFSDTYALYSLGIVATLGIVAIFLLLLFMKGRDNAA